MTYIFNPKSKGSGVICAIPQTGRCPNNCEDCFFQSGRSYLEPLDENLPNLPSLDQATGRIVRVNDGNDSNVYREETMAAVCGYPMKFYNTAIPRLDFDAPVVMTVNPGEMTDMTFYDIYSPPKNLMFVRVRANLWNMDTVVRPAVEFYAEREIPIVLTFMAYYDDKPKEMGFESSYIYRKRTMNSYHAITTDAWLKVMDEFRLNRWVYSCGKVEGERGISGCRFCGNCLREYFATCERMRGDN